PPSRPATPSMAASQPAICRPLGVSAPLGTILGASRRAWRPPHSLRYAGPPEHGRWVGSGGAESARAVGGVGWRGVGAGGGWGRVARSRARGLVGAGGAERPPGSPLGS